MFHSFPLHETPKSHQKQSITIIILVLFQNNHVSKRLFAGPIHLTGGSRIADHESDTAFKKTLMDEEEDLKFKVIIVGDVSVGKTSLARRQAFNSFEFKMESTVGIDHLTTTLHVQDQAVKLLLWDTAGQEQYKSLVPVYSRGAQVCVLVGYIVDPDSVASLEMWQERVRDENKDVPIVVAINKTDLREGAPMTMDGIREKCHPLFPDIFFVSARTGDLVPQLFQQVALAAMHGPGWVDDPALTPVRQASDRSCC
jgi:small GTP-binding protein